MGFFHVSHLYVSKQTVNPAPLHNFILCGCRTLALRRPPLHLTILDEVAQDLRFYFLDKCCNYRKKCKHNQIAIKLY